MTTQEQCIKYNFCSSLNSDKRINEQKIGGGTGEGKKYLSFGKFGVLYFLVTLALRLTLLPTNYALSSIHLNR